MLPETAQCVGLACGNACELFKDSAGMCDNVLMMF